MKVLFLPFSRNRFDYPVTQIKGGIESVEVSQLKALKSLGYDVTIAMTQECVCAGFKTITLPIESFETCGQYKQTKVLDYISNSGIYKDFDVILSNRCWKLDIRHKRMEAIKEWAPKLRVINHEPPAYLKGFSFPNVLATSKWLSLNGARTATVMQNGNEIFSQLETNLRTGVNFPQQMVEHNELFDSVPTSSFTDFYEVMVVGTDHQDINKIKHSSDILFVGRPTKVKGLSHAIRGTKEAERLDSFVGFTAAPSGKVETKDWEALKELQKYFTVSAPHDKIMEALTAASVFLQPTASESAGGIVAFEAAAHGVPVITSTDACKRYLDPYGLYHFIEDRSPATIAEAIKSLKPLTIQKKKETAMKVREDFSQEAYAKNLANFLSK